MGIQYNSIIATDGLLYCLDAANQRSYSGSGNTWFDISNNQRTTILYNSPTYSSNQSGYFTFTSAGSKYGTFTSPTSLSTFTAEAWIYFDSLPAVNTVPAIITQTFPGSTSRINYSLGFNGTNGTGAYDGKLNGGFYDGTWRLTSGFTPSINTWYHTCVTYNGSTIIQYSQGVSQSTLSYSGTPTGSGSSSIIMKRWDDPNFLNARLSVVRLYNRALSADEILSNYNAAKNRYGL